MQGHERWMCSGHSASARSTVPQWSHSSIGTPFSFELVKVVVHERAWFSIGTNINWLEHTRNESTCDCWGRVTFLSDTKSLTVYGIKFFGVTESIASVNRGHIGWWAGWRVPVG